MADSGSSRSDNSTDSPTIIPQALTSPISFLSATPPPDSSPAASLADPDVLARCLGPSVMLMSGVAGLVYLVVFWLSFVFSSVSPPAASRALVSRCARASPCASKLRHVRHLAR